MSSRDYKIRRSIKHLRSRIPRAMGPADILIHLLNFAAPALFLAVLMPVLARTMGRPAAGATRLWVQMVANALAGLAALSAGLWYFGHDGKMLTYASLVAAVASSQWLAGRAWRG